MGQPRLFIRPDVEAFKADPALPYADKYQSYSHYNYLRPGLVTRFKRSRLELALKLAQAHFGPNSNAIDMGCADGILLASLSKHFGHVVGCDFDETSIRYATNLVESMGLTNVELINNKTIPAAELKTRLGDRKYSVMFVLETLEHVGHSTTTMYEDKMTFLDEQFGLLEPGGVIIVSVPKMMGGAFLLKYLVQATLRMHKEPVSFKDIWRSVVHKDASSLEHRWEGGHVGFNEHKLERLIVERYDVVERKNLAATLMWKLRRRSK
jgi:2-polyprenyl-3-methyl-5-hydroxy-6-metoxy-1,4-benzoquinol methylase